MKIEITRDFIFSDKMTNLAKFDVMMRENSTSKEPVFVGVIISLEIEY